MSKYVVKDLGGPHIYGRFYDRDEAIKAASGLAAQNIMAIGVYEVKALSPLLNKFNLIQAVMRE